MHTHCETNDNSCPIMRFFNRSAVCEPPEKKQGPRWEAFYFINAFYLFEEIIRISNPINNKIVVAYHQNKLHKKKTTFFCTEGAKKNRSPYRYFS